MGGAYTLQRGDFPSLPPASVLVESGDVLLQCSVQSQVTYFEKNFVCGIKSWVASPLPLSIIC